MLNAKRLTTAVPYFASLALLAYMPFHIFLAQSLSLATGGLEVWKIAKDGIAILLCLFVICSVFVAGRATKTFKIIVGLLLAYGAFHGLLWLVNPDIYTKSALLGSVHNVRLPGFLVIGYGAALLLPRPIDWRPVIRLVLIASTIVSLLGIAQFFLPKDILTHVGYGLDRGARAAFFIDDKEGLPRIMSTLREPNALGAFLLVPATLLMWLALELREKRTKLLAAGALAAHVIAIGLTFSRSAWGGLLLAAMLVAVWRYGARIVTFAKRYWLILLAVLLIGGIGAYALKDHPLVDSYITHGSEDADLDSNDYHWLFFKQGVEGIIDTPFGHGPGTAGLASIQNPDGSFLTENYYVQVGYEIGVLGLLVFIGLNVFVYVQLWHRRQQTLVKALLITFWAYVGINMFLHIWSNEAVACQWWLLAGLALVYEPSKLKE